MVEKLQQIINNYDDEVVCIQQQLSALVIKSAAL